MTECKDIFLDTTGLLDSYLDTIMDKEMLLPDTTSERQNTVFDTYMEDSIKEKLNDKWRVSNTYKRLATIVSDFNFKKSNIISQKVKEYFINKGVKIDEDKKKGHKIYIEY